MQLFSLSRTVANGLPLSGGLFLEILLENGELSLFLGGLGLAHLPLNHYLVRVHCAPVTVVNSLELSRAVESGLVHSVSS